MSAVAVLDARGRSRALAEALRSAGWRADLVAPPFVAAPVGRLLRMRAFEPELHALPFALRALHRLSPDLAHALTLPDAAAAVRWSERTGRPAVLTVDAAVDRSMVASHRRRLRLTEEVRGRCTVLATDEDVAASLDRWLGIPARVVAPHDAAALTSLYRHLIEEEPRP